VYCEDCRGYYRKADQRRYRAIREEIVSLLGGSCANCGSDGRGLLEIDHVHSDGYLERAEFGNGRHMYKQILVQLRSDPTDRRYQLLCFTCHQEKTRTRNAA
jgi:5-methylcytosine-specific restriction endonuclease McrA